MPKIEIGELKTIKQVSRKDIAFSMTRLEDAGRLLFGSSDANLYDVDLADDQPRVESYEKGHTSYVMGVARLGGQVVTGAYDGHLIWWDLESRRQRHSSRCHDRWIRGVVASPDETVVASVADDMVCRLWNRDGKLVHELRGHARKTPQHYNSMLFCCAFSPDGTYLATADKVGHVIVWEVSSGKSIVRMDAPKLYTWDPKQRRHSIGGARSLAFSPDSRRLAVGGIGQIGNIDHLGAKARVELFDWRKGELVASFPGDRFKGLVEHLAYHPRGDWLLAAGGDHKGFVTFLDPESLGPLKQEAAPMHVHELALNETADRIYAVGHNRLVLWRIAAAAREF